VLRFIFTAKDANREEVEQVAESREPILENLGIGLKVQYLCIAFHCMSFGTAPVTIDQNDLGRRFRHQQRVRRGRAYKARADYSDSRDPRADFGPVSISSIR
jgi:hypothetical protein